MKNKKIVTILSLILLSLFINIKVFAAEKHVYVNAGAKDLLAGDTFEGATFDSSTNTLTLNNYNAGYILFEEFENETVYIVLNGTNIIDSLGGNGNGISCTNTASVPTNMEFTGNSGSSLKIVDFYDGIYTHDGNITINNCNIEIINTTDCAIYTIKGKVNINNSQINIDTASYGIGSDDNVVTLNNVVYTASSIGDDAIYASYFNADKLTGYFNNVGNASEDAIFNTVDIAESKLTNSNINVGTANYFFMGNIFSVKDTTINIDRINTFVSCASVTFDGSTVYIDKIVDDCIPYCQLVEIKNSDFTVVDGTCISLTGGVICAKEIDIIDSNVDITGTTLCVTGAKIVIDHSNVHLKSQYMAAILTTPMDSNSLVLKNTTLTETDYSLYETILGFDDDDDTVPIVLYLSEEPADSYLFPSTLDSLVDIALQEAHFVAEDNPNPETFDISVLYIIIGILSVVGISIAKFDLDLLKNK